MTIDYDKLILNKNRQPLRILHCGKHTCIRVIKIARALMKTGYKLDVLTNKISYGIDDFEKVYYWSNERQFKNFLYAHKDNYDIIEIHNEPDYMVTWARDVIQQEERPKIISNLHDIDSVRLLNDVIPKTERRMFNAADAFVYCSLPIQEMTNELHAVSKPNIVLYSYCNKDLIELDWNAERANALVYEGGVNPPGQNDQNEVFPYRNLFPVFKQLVDQGNEVHAIVGNSDAFIKGQHLGVVLHQPVLYDTLIEELPKYKYGILIFNNRNNDQPQVRYTLTNKFFEYTAAGLPSLACWCEESEKLVDKWGVGFTFSDIEEIGDCSVINEKYDEKIENIKVFNDKVFMENFIWKLENLYATVLNVDKKGVPADIRNLSEFEYGKEETNKLLSED